MQNSCRANYRIPKYAKIDLQTRFLDHFYTIPTYKNLPGPPEPWELAENFKIQLKSTQTFPPKSKIRMTAQKLHSLYENTIEVLLTNRICDKDTWVVMGHIIEYLARNRCSWGQYHLQWNVILASSTRYVLVPSAHVLVPKGHAVARRRVNSEWQPCAESGDPSALVWKQV